MDFKYIIPLNDLKSGVSTYCWDVCGEFFKEFDNEEISSAEIKVDVKASKTGSSVEVDLDIRGVVTVPCDRCLEDVDMDIDTGASLKIRFGGSSTEEDEEDGREVVWIPAGETDLDLAQTIYDYVCLDLPIQRFHRDGDCNPEVLRHLVSDPGKESAPEEPSGDNPFASLQNLFEK